MQACSSRFSIPYSSVVLLHVIQVLCFFMFGGLPSLVKDPRAGMPDVGHKLPSLLKKKFYIFEIPPDCGSYSCGVVFGDSEFLPLLPNSVWLFYPLLWRLFQRKFSGLFRGNYSICICRLLVSKIGGESTIFLCCHLEPPSE